METLSKARIKLIQSLHHKKFRLKYNKFIVEGLKITKELLGEKRHLVEEVLISNPDHIPLLSQLAENVSIIEIAPQYMHQISQMSTPPGVLTICHLPNESVMPEHLSGMKVFYLDAIRDPGNLGTILRIADWFGLDLVLLSPDCVDIYNYKVLQASMGSALRVKTIELDKTALLSISAGNLYVCDTEGTNIDGIDPPGDGILVLGNESLGVSDELLHQVKEILTIPGHHRLGAESLNVASAAAIMAHWWTK
jgi:RNA methyltransferase, TrmH family